VTDEQMIRVVFVDAASGAEFGRAGIAPDELPETFGPGTTLMLGGDDYVVEQAEPAGFRAAGALTLTLRRVEAVDPQELLFSLPTICDTVPAAEQLGELHEDDWRQIEFVAEGLRDVVETEFGAIRAIYEHEAEFDADDSLTGFRRLHVREHPAAPLPGPVSRERLLALLPAGEHTDGPGSFARTIGPVLVYGLSDADAVTVLGVQFSGAPGTALAGPLREVMTTFHLALVDWCRCELAGPDGIEDYLAEESAV
jgi:hypothetical protein